MEFTVTFLKVFLIGLAYVSPVLLTLIVTIVLLGALIGKYEKWSLTDAIYFAFITATTVGYGDIRPSHKASKYIAILIAIIGILMTGIIVAVGVKGVEVAFEAIYTN